jgi:tRNA nucleotidyltransferase (CCA-adding enzyme)
LLGLPVKDTDLEAYGIPAEQLISLLSARARIDLVGQAFGVIKLHGLPVDIAIPRRESKSGHGHKDFEVLSDPFLTPEEAASRRDFTMNSMAFDLLTGELIDPYGGAMDLAKRILRHTSTKFTEDPLRVLRGMQFAARFDLRPAKETVALCRTIGMEDMARERVFGEWQKLILQGVKPSVGLSFLQETRWIQFFPELEALLGCRQEPEWHPEGDVWAHTLLCMDAFARERVTDDWEDLVVGLAVLCHDFGKPSTTALIHGRIRSMNHEEAGENPTRSFLERMTTHRALVESVVPLVTNHLKPLELFDGGAGDSAIRRLSVKVGRIDRLVRVARSDQLGRGPLSVDSFPAGDWLLERARAMEIQNARPQPLVLGRHLIGLGLEPGPSFGRILKKCYDAQINGAFGSVEEAIAYAKAVIADSPSVRDP